MLIKDSAILIIFRFDVSKKIRFVTLFFDNVSFKRNKSTTSLSLVPQLYMGNTRHRDKRTSKDVR